MSVVVVVSKRAYVQGSSYILIQSVDNHQKLSLPFCIFKLSLHVDTYDIRDQI